MGRKAVSYLFHHLTILLSVALVVAAEFCRRASTIAPQHDSLLSILAMITPLVLLANGAMFIWWVARGKWLIMFIPAIAFGLNWSYITATIQPPKFSTTTAPHDLRIATLNVHGFSTQESPQESVMAIVNEMAKEGVDVICMQEFAQERHMSYQDVAAMFHERMPYFAYSGSTAIASRYPIIEYIYTIFPETSNDYMRADLLVGRDTIRLFSAHLQTAGVSRLHRLYRKANGGDVTAMGLVQVLQKNNAIRAQQVDTIRQEMDRSPYPIIVAGDFNDLPSSYTYTTLKRGMTDGFQQSGSGFGSTFRPLKSLLRIDYILYDKSFEALDYQISDEHISDHKAVIATLKFNR